LGHEFFGGGVVKNEGLHDLHSKRTFEYEAAKYGIIAELRDFPQSADELDMTFCDRAKWVRSGSLDISLKDLDADIAFVGILDAASV